MSQGLREGAGTEPSADASKGSRLNDSANFQESASSEPLDKWQNIWQSGYFPLSEGQKLINVETVSTDSFVSGIMVLTSTHLKRSSTILAEPF